MREGTVLKWSFLSKLRATTLPKDRTAPFLSLSVQIVGRLRHTT